ncbi:MAG: hypothetical protein ABW056_11950 [Thermoanaerobaculia bacterium]
MYSITLVAAFTWLMAFANLAQTPEVQPAKIRLVGIDARAEVVTKPRPVVRKDGHKVLEFEAQLLAYFLAPEQPVGADRTITVEMTERVRVVHDLSCGGGVALAVGDKVELRGEYVMSPEGRPDVIGFTHAPGGEGCGDKAHPAGYLRKIVPATPTPAVTSPRPSGIVPDQPYVGTPAALQKAYAEILRLKQEGASDEKLLEKIRAEKKVYSLSLDDMQKLRAAGVSSAVIEAMLQSGRGPVTPGANPAPTATPGT